LSFAWWSTLTIAALGGGLRQEYQEIEASLGYIVGPCLKRKRMKWQGIYWKKIFPNPIAEKCLFCATKGYNPIIRKNKKL
jgi:hypothetical protein